MKTFLTIARPSQVATITGRQPFARPNQTHKDKRNEYKRKPKFGKGWE